MGQIRVKSGKDLQRREHLAVPVNGPQGVRHRPCRLGDDERIPGVRLGLAGIQVRGFAHRQARKVGHGAAAVPRHGYRQRPDGVGLIHDHQHPAVLLQTEEKLAQPRLILGQRLVEDPFSRGVQCGGVMLGFADI